MELKAPSGLVVEARPFKGKEIVALVEALEETSSMSSRAMVDILTACWLSTVDLGPYDFPQDTRPDFYGRVLKGDVLALLLWLRIGTFRDGRQYDTVVRCEQCGSRVPWGCDLVDHVLSRPKLLPQESINHLASKEPLVVDVLASNKDGSSVTRKLGFRLNSLKAEEPMQAWIKQQIKRKARRTRKQLLIDRMAAQTVTIDGQRVQPSQAWNFLAELDAEPFQQLRDAMDEADCGVDNTITAKCPECLWEFDTDLPLGSSFLEPNILSRRDRLFGVVKEPAAAAETDTTSETTPTT